MRTSIAFALLGLLGASAHAIPSDVKVLAQFDLGFARCEARFPQMKGHADEAYLALWKVKPDDKARADLAKARKTAQYKDARKQAQKTQDNSSSPEIEDKLKHQCLATWNEAQRTAPQGGKP
ncbi:hypothetical protein ACVNIS_16605 [Sphaerotilaceae bacterium SBD11-9]